LRVAVATEPEARAVAVTCLCPGAPKPRFDAVAGSSRSRLFQGTGVMSSPDVARAGVEGLLAGKAIVVPGWRNKLVTWGAGLGPRTLAARIAGRFQETA